MTSRQTHLSSPNVTGMSSATSARLPATTNTKYPRVRAQSSRSAAQMAGLDAADIDDLAEIDLDGELLDFDEDDNNNNNNNNNNNHSDDNAAAAISPRSAKRTSAAKSFLNVLTGRGKPKNASKGAEKKAPTRSERMGAARTSFTFAADEVDDDVALFGPDASGQHKSKKWFAWLARLNPIGPISPHAPAAAAAAAATSSPTPNNARSVPARAAVSAMHAEADADAASGTRLTATSIEVCICPPGPGALVSPIVSCFSCFCRNCRMKSAPISTSVDSLIPTFVNTFGWSWPLSSLSARFASTIHGKTNRKRKQVRGGRTDDESISQYLHFLHF
jgi:hypothetical protein